MANFPNSGSSDILLKRQANVSWGRAIAGWALFGVVGGAVGAITGEEKTANVCLDCGTSWKASDLYKTLQVIKTFSGETLDLSFENHRVFMNQFIVEVIPRIEAAHKTNQKAEKMLEDSKKLADQSAIGTFSGCGFVLGIVGYVATVTTFGANVGFLLFLGLSLIGFLSAY